MSLFPVRPSSCMFFSYPSQDMSPTLLVTFPRKMSLSLTSFFESFLGACDFFSECRGKLLSIGLDILRVVVYASMDFIKESSSTLSHTFNQKIRIKINFNETTFQSTSTARASVEGWTETHWKVLSQYGFLSQGLIFVLWGGGTLS
jgi:hypothetical protein